MSIFLMWKNSLNVRSKNSHVQVSKSNSTKIKYGYKKVKSKAQTSVYNQLLEVPHQPEIKSI